MQRQSSLKKYLKYHLEAIVDYLKSTGNHLSPAQQQAYTDLLSQIANLPALEADRDAIRANIKNLVSGHDKNLDKTIDEINALADNYYVTRNTTKFKREVKQIIEKKPSRKKSNLRAQMNFNLRTEAPVQMIEKSDKQVKHIQLDTPMKVGMIGDAVDAMNNALDIYAHNRSGVELIKESNSQIFRVTEHFGHVSCLVDFTRNTPHINHRAYSNKNSHAVMLGFDIHNAATFENVIKWIAEHRKYNVNHAPILLVGLYNSEHPSGQAINPQAIHDICVEHDLSYLSTDMAALWDIKHLFKIAALLGAHSTNSNQVPWLLIEKALTDYPQNSKRAKLAATKAYKTKAIHGLFESKKIDSGVASVIAKYISPEDAGRITGTNKSAYNKANSPAQSNQSLQPDKLSLKNKGPRGR